MVMRNADYFRTLFFSSWRKAWMPCGPHGRLPLYSRERQHPTRGQRWLLSVYDTQRVYQLYNSTQSPRPCKISSKPYSPSPKSHHLPKIVRLLPSCPISLTTSFTSHSLYAVKAGYPPRALTAVIPELPLSSLGLAPSDQLIVVQKSGSASAAAPTSSSSLSSSSPGRTPTAARPTHGPSSNLPRQAVASTPARSATIESEDDGRGRPDYVTMDGGYLIHRVRTRDLKLSALI